jgi:hypothetical protein
MHAFPVATALIASTACAQSVRFVERAAIDCHGAEVVAFDRESMRFFTTASRGLALVDAVGETVETIDLGEPAHALTHVAVGPPGSHLVYVAAGPDCTNGEVIVLDARTRESTRITLPSSGPDALALTPDGRTVLVACEGEPCEDANGAMREPPGALVLFAADRKSVV